MNSDWFHPALLTFLVINASILASVVWRQVRERPVPPVEHCLITRESYCQIGRAHV